MWGLTARWGLTSRYDTLLTKPLWLWLRYGFPWQANGQCRWSTFQLVSTAHIFCQLSPVVCRWGLGPDHKQEVLQESVLASLRSRCTVGWQFIPHTIRGSHPGHHWSYRRTSTSMERQAIWGRRLGADKKPIKKIFASSKLCYFLEKLNGFIQYLKK